MPLVLIVDNESTCREVPDIAQLERWALAALQHAGDWEVGLRIVDEPESQALNRDYRGKDKPTNVLSFPFELPPGLEAEMLEEAPPLGDLVICAPVVVQEARDQGKTLEAHWAHLVIHGMLHLQGHDHLLDQDAEVMENLEKRLMAELGFPDPYDDHPSATEC